MSTSPDFRLVLDQLAVPLAPELDDGQRQIVAHESGLLRILAGPGTGKTTAIVELILDRVRNRAVPISSILVLTFSRGAASEIRNRVTARLQSTISEAVARTFHSYAFGLVRRAAVLAGEPAPRLLSGSEQDVTVRELLAGRLDAGRDRWPAELAAALRTTAFSTQLRDLLMRAIERDVTPSELTTLGKRHNRPDWVIAAGLLREYQDVTALQSPGAFDAAELIQRAHEQLLANPALLAVERSTRRVIIVDEYQDTDPAQRALLALVASGCSELVLIGDPDQAIYGFRGAEQNALSDVESDFGHALAGELHTVTLDVSYRSSPTLLAATRRIAARLPGPARHRQLTSAVPDSSQADAAASTQQWWQRPLTVSLFSSNSQEAVQIASRLRRAHFDEGVAWSQMAVIVRSAGADTDTLRRGLAASGVPVRQALRGALLDEPVVAHLMLAMRCVATAIAAGDSVAAADGAVTESPRATELTVADAESLLTGPIGRADPLALLRIKRQLARAQSGITLLDLVIEPAGSSLIPPDLSRPVERVRSVVQAGIDVALGAVVPSAIAAEDILWAVWSATGLASVLSDRSVAGGAEGARADRDLDGVLELFAEAAKVADRSPGGGIAALDEWLTQLQIADAVFDRRPIFGDVVPIVTAHASKGLEWDVVCLANVSEGSWPDLRRRGSLLGADELVDVVAGTPISTTAGLAARVAEERRLFYVACTRAKRVLFVSAIDNDETQPSRFLDELDPLPINVERRPVTEPTGRFLLSGLVAELRAVVNDAAVTETHREAAATELARLAAAGVRGADPAQWWGLAPLSSDRPIRPVEAGPVPIRPSKFAAYTECELRALFAEVGATDAADEIAASLGTLVHWVAEHAPEGASLAELVDLLDAGWSRLEFAAPWHARNERARAQRMLVALADWLAASRGEFSLIAKEESFAVTVGDVKLSGTVDRLERDAAGRLVVVDLKSSKNKPTKNDVLVHPQLAAYQVAVAEGGFTQGVPAVAGGAVLLQIGASPPGTMEQVPLDESPQPRWPYDELARIATVLRGTTVTATPGKACERCLVRLSCPAQLDGQAVTQ